MHLFRSAAFASLIVITPLLLGEVINPDGLNPESFYGKDSNQGVYVRESAVALEKLALARRMEGHREWNKSADVFQEILENYPDRVVPSQLDPNKNIYQYTSVVMAVQEHLARWPEEGLNVYRARYETAAQTLLEQASRDDFASLHKVFSLYFVTESAKAAGIRLVDMYFETGEFPAAAWLGDRLLKWHPSLVAERPAVLYRTALAYHLSGDGTNAQQKLAELKDKHADATGTVRGGDVVLAESLEQELQARPPVSQASVADSWPMLGGNAARSRISAARGRPGAKLFGVELSRPLLPRMNPNQRQEIEQQDQRDRESGMMLGVMPAVDRGELFFQDGARVYAVSLESGVPLPGWSATYGGDRAGKYVVNNAWALPRNQQLTVTLTDDAVVAVMGFADPLAAMMGAMGGAGAGRPNQQETRLVCLDRTNGKERWAITPKQLPQALKAINFSGSPLVVSENVYVIGRGGKGNQFEDCYVICLNLRTGDYRWSCYVASASTANQMWGGEPLTFDSTSHLAYDSGRLYVLTNLGALAAIDAYSGAIQWLNIYPRDVVNDFEEGLVRLRGRRGGGGGGTNTADGRPWTQNPVMVKDGKVFILPTDSQFILVYDAAGGVEAKRIRLADLRNCDTLLAVAGENMIVAGEGMAGGRPIALLYHFNWKNYKAGATNDQNPDTGVLLWKKELPAPIRGRGFVTDDSIFLPTQERLFRIDIRNGKVEESYPRYPSTWEKGEGPGNVLVTQDHVIIAGSRKVDVFTDMQVARAKLDAQVAAAPSDPDPRLKYAEVMFVAGERELAMQKLDEAIELLGGISAIRSGPGRDRIFNDAMTFAEKLADEDKPESIAMATELFDRAGVSAGSASQKVNYRVSRARFAHDIRDYAAEAALYQEILSSPEMRVVSLSANDSTGSVQAGTIAERSIATLIKNEGPACYAPFEQAASEQLAAALASAEDDRAANLLAVAQVYPNSGVAPQAMLAAAAAFETAGNHRQATQILRRSYFKYPDSPQKVSVIEAMARNYLRMPNRADVATARLAQAVKLDPNRQIEKPLLMPDGQTMQDAPLSAALTLLQKHQQAAAAQKLADYHLPLPVTSEQRAAGQKQAKAFDADGEQSDITGVAALVLPLREYTRHDRIVTWASSGLSVYEVGQTAPLFTSDAFRTQPMLCAWTGDDRLLVWSGSEMVALPVDGGQPMWKAELKSLPPIEVVQLEQDSSHGPPVNIGAGPRVIAGDGVMIQDNEVVIVGNDQIRQQQRLQLNRIARMAAPANIGLAPQGDAPGEEQIVHVEPTTDRIVVGTSTGRVFAINPDDGSTAWQTRLSSRRIARLLATDDFAVALVNDDSVMQIIVLDTYEGSFVNHWNFPTESGVFPINLALSPDGMLVYTLPDRLCGKDLFEPGAEMNYQEPQQQTQQNGGGGGGANNPLFHGAGAIGQLVIADGRILAVGDNAQFVRVYSLETGRLNEFVIDDRNEFGLPTLAKPDAREWNVWLRTAGPHLYVVGRQSLVAYNLDRPEQSWHKPPDTIVQENFVDAFIGQDYLLLLDQPSRSGARPNANANANAAAEAADRNAPYRLLGCSRAKLKDRDNKESGLWVYDFELPTPPQPNQWQAVEGGFYYLGTDNTLRLLRGTRQEPLEM